MEGPAVKRPKLLQQLSISSQDWTKWFNNLELLQSGLVTGCLCHVEAVELHRPVFSSLLSLNLEESSPDFPEDYTLQFISTLKSLCDVALAQHTSGFICTKISDMGSAVSTDEEIWGMLLQLLDSSVQFISYMTSKCLASILMWTRSARVDGVFEVLCNSIVSSSTNPLKLTSTLDVIRNIVEFKEDDEHPLGLPDESDQISRCTRIEIDFDSEEEDIDVKDVCLKVLDDWWTRFLIKLKNLLSNYEVTNEYSILTFLTLWQSIVSVKSNLNVVDTKQFYLQVETFVPFLNSALPPVLWKKLIDVFNEILCYGSTLSLQDALPEEPCELAHLILRCVKSRQFLPGVPYSRDFVGFGGTSYKKPVDSEWGSGYNQEGRAPETNMTPSTSPTLPAAYMSTYPSLNISSHPGPAFAPSSSNSSMTATTSHAHQQPFVEPSPSTSTRSVESIDRPAPSSQTSLVRNVVTASIYIGPTPDAVAPDDELEDSGDRPLLQKLVLLILKCVAVTVKETKDESDSSGGDDEEGAEPNERSISDSDTNDMVIIQRSVVEVFQQLDIFVKSLLPFHPSAPLGDWMVKLFSDQDDVLVEGMLCTLDCFTSFIGRIDITTEFYETLNPVMTFIAFAKTVSEDKDILLDLLMSNETCFLLYFLRFLKYSFKHWNYFVSTCGRDMEKIMGLLIRLKIALGRLVEKSLFPYNINPVLRLLEKCEETYESSNNTSSTS